MSRAYKNKKYNKDNYIKFGVSPKYFGLQAKRFPGSVKKAYCDIDRDEEAEVTFTKRRSPAVRKGYDCLTVSNFAPAFGPKDLFLSQAAPELGPADLESIAFQVPVSGPSNLSVLTPAAGPQNLSSSTLASSTGPQNLTSSIIVPAAGPQSLEVSSNPNSGPQNLSSSFLAPSIGPQNLTFSIIIPEAGPQSLEAAEKITVDDPALSFTINPDSFVTSGYANYRGHYVYDPNSKLKNYITQYSGSPTVIDLSTYSTQYQTFKGASLNNYGRFTKAYNIDCTEYQGAEVTVYRQVSWSQDLFTWHFTVDGSPGLDITATTTSGTAALNILNLDVSISGQTGNDPWIEAYDDQSCG